MRASAGWGEAGAGVLGWGRWGGLERGRRFGRGTNGAGRTSRAQLHVILSPMSGQKSQHRMELPYCMVTILILGKGWKSPFPKEPAEADWGSQNAVVATFGTTAVLCSGQVGIWLPVRSGVQDHYYQNIKIHSFWFGFNFKQLRASLIIAFWLTATPAFMSLHWHNDQLQVSIYPISISRSLGWFLLSCQPYRWSIWQIYKNWSLRGLFIKNWVLCIQVQSTQCTLIEAMIWPASAKSLLHVKA